MEILWFYIYLLERDVVSGEEYTCLFRKFLRFLWRGLKPCLSFAGTLGVCDLTFPALVSEPCDGIHLHLLVSIMRSNK